MVASGDVGGAIPEDLYKYGPRAAATKHSLKISQQGSHASRIYDRYIVGYISRDRYIVGFIATYIFATCQRYMIT